MNLKEKLTNWLNSNFELASHDIEELAKTHKKYHEMFLNANFETAYKAAIKIKLVNEWLDALQDHAPESTLIGRYKNWKHFLFTGEFYLKSTNPVSNLKRIWDAEIKGEMLQKMESFINEFDIKID